MVNVRKMIINQEKFETKCPYPMQAETITIHNTGNDASAENERNNVNRVDNNAEVSFHYAVDDIGVVQLVEENRNTWHAGDGGNGEGNRKSIALEICYSKSGGSRFDKAEENAAEFVASILKRKGWGIDRVRKHQDWSGKYCPARTMDKGWQRFLNMIQANINGGTVSQPTQPSQPTISSSEKTYAENGRFYFNTDVIVRTAMEEDARTSTVYYAGESVIYHTVTLNKNGFNWIHYARNNGTTGYLKVRDLTSGERYGYAV